MTYTIESPCGKYSSTAFIIFIVNELRVPEIITPNGDGKNDVLIIDGIEYYPESVLEIYNRYGHIVFTQRGYDNTWNGYSNRGSLGGDKPLPAGTYYYRLTYNQGNNRQAGVIYLFR
jgi:gliding motility-associated-like protein